MMRQMLGSPALLRSPALLGSPALLPATTLILAGLLLAGCGSDVERVFGLTKDAPDEFTVETRAPLSMPPNYTLSPPQPGAARPQELSAQQAAEAALAPDTALHAPGGPDSPGQSALVAQAGPAAPADIRDRVNGEAQTDRGGRSLTERLMFWRDPPPPGAPLDPAAESQRLRENAALGQPATVGSTPIIQPKKSSGFLGVF